ncbi:hypothetical protein SAMN05518672_1011288 [Chitinophaga sp. CF118]|nr:hypothetical protein SAMN05518672_1011288 [Chitinophaga sp. CF118]
MQTMKPALKPFQKSLSLIIIPVSFVLFYIYGWTFISTLLKLNNFYGNLYNYYHVSALSFSIYNLLVAFIAGILTVRLVKGVLNKRQKYVKQSLWIFLALAAILVSGEIILHLSLEGRL